DVSVRREDAEVRVSVMLGPDSSAMAETERAWLMRMAMRYGGRLQLEGGAGAIFLPADRAHGQREVEALRRDLEAAQRQGEAYARELAAVFSYPGSNPPPRFTTTPPETGISLSAMAGMASVVASQLRTILDGLGRTFHAMVQSTGPTSEA